MHLVSLSLAIFRPGVVYRTTPDPTKLSTIDLEELVAESCIAIYRPDTGKEWLGVNYAYADDSPTDEDLGIVDGICTRELFVLLGYGHIEHNWVGTHPGSQWISEHFANGNYEELRDALPKIYRSVVSMASTDPRYPSLVAKEVYFDLLSAWGVETSTDWETGIVDDVFVNFAGLVTDFNCIPVPPIENDAPQA